MNSTATRAKKRPPPKRPAARRPRPRKPSTARRLAPWVAAAMAAVVVVAMVATRGDSGSGSGADGAAGSFVGGDLHSLVVDAADPDRLFVGGHQAAAASSDGGHTWAQVQSLRDADAMGWAITSDMVWMGGHPGLRRSTDGGRSFEPAGGELSSTDVHALGGTADVLFAASPARGLLASTDGGETWEIRSIEAGQGFMGGIVVDPDDPEHLLAPDMQAGVVESRDGGRTWAPLGSPGMAMSVTTVGGSVDDLVVAGGGQAARSRDGGATWQPFEVPEETMVVTGAEDGALYAAVLDGEVARVSRSSDDGATWELLNP